MGRSSKPSRRKGNSRSNPRWSDMAARVRRNGERIIVRESGRKAVGMVPAADLRLLEAIEDEIDAAEVRRIMKSAKPSDFLPIEKLKVRLGL